MTTKLYHSLIPIRILFHQLWASLSKSDFYYNLVKFYKGYGIKYFLFQIILCVILSSGLVFDNILLFKDYFATSRVTSRTKNIDHIIEQLPRFYYNGNHIESDETNAMPIYIYDMGGRKLAVFDFTNNLSHNERDKIPLIFGSKKLLVNLVHNKQKNHDNMIIDYHKIFDSEARIIDKESVKIAINNYLKYSSVIFILFLVIILTIIYTSFLSITLLIKQFFIVSLIYILVNSLHVRLDIEQILKKFKSEFDQFSRLVFFSSGSALLIQFLFIYLMPSKAPLINFLHLWLGYLIYQGLNKKLT